MERTHKIHKYENYAPKDSIYDDTTGHVLVAQGDSVIEMKYCIGCKKWHPVANYYDSKRTKDGLSRYCKEYLRLQSLKYKVEKNKHLSGKPIVTKKMKKKKDSQKKNPTDAISNALYALYNNLISDYKRQIDELKQTVDSLNTRSNGIIDPNKMTDAEFEKLVMSRKGVQPRVYFNAIKKLDIDNKYTIMVFDSSTGLTTTIKTDVA